MKTSKELLEAVKKLSELEREQLVNELLSYRESGKKLHLSVQKELSSKGVKKPCPHCKSTNVYRKGKQYGIQNYQCQQCKKCYGEHYGTPLWDIKKKDKFEKYIECMQRGMSLRAIKDELGISLQTSFDWRHKILGSLQSQVPSQLGPIVECDELELPINNKGDRNLDRPARKRSGDFERNKTAGEVTTVQVVSAVDRSGNKYFKAVATKRLTEEQLSQALEDKIQPQSLLITDEHPTYKAFVKKHQIANHKMIKSIRYLHRDDKTINLQRVNNAHMQLRKFLAPFGSVSSKYLQNYLNWFAHGKTLNENINKIRVWMTIIATANQAYELFWAFKQNAVILRT